MHPAHRSKRPRRHCSGHHRGEENASSEFTRESVKPLLKEKESEGWTFAFLGADIDSYAVGGSVGVSPSNTANYVKGNEKALFSNLVKHSFRIPRFLIGLANTYRTDRK